MRRTEFLENELAEAKFDIIGLSCRVTRAEDLSRDLEDKLTDLEKENSGLRNKIKMLEVLVQNKADLIEQLEGKLNDLGNDNDKLHYRLDDALEEISTLEERLNYERKW